MIEFFSFNGLELYPKAYRGFISGQPIKLTDTEFYIEENTLGEQRTDR